MQYIRNNLIAGLKSSPLPNLRFSLLVTILYGVLAFAIGAFGGVFNYGLLDSQLIFFLPITMFVFPCLLEEGFFRGLLIPRSVFDKSVGLKATAIVGSSLLFTLWHPLNAFLFNFGAQPFFYDLYFLAIVFVLGIACGIVYIASRSLWVPIFMHWLTVFVWVLFLGGRNLVKDI